MRGLIWILCYKRNLKIKGILEDLDLILEGIPHLNALNYTLSKNYEAQEIYYLRVLLTSVFRTIVKKAFNAFTL